jgi:thiamine biosynthesis protein ThiS
MITVRINGEERQFESGSTVEDLLTQLKVKRDRLAVERNREIVPRDSYANAVLQEGDVLEIVSLVGGG